MEQLHHADEVATVFALSRLRRCSRATVRRYAEALGIRGKGKRGMYYTEADAQRIADALDRERQERARRRLDDSTTERRARMQARADRAARRG
jgi:hypothetical protein